ncbi:MAG: urea carboxylase [Verrucomicrobiae bacterium]|nr:urea carboxylase [Verrucomicrobiae bacterium]
MFKKILIANRGEIACRIARTLRNLGVSPVAIYSQADRDSLHVAAADEAFCVGPAPVKESYLNQQAILEIAKSTGAEAIHPGYGLLSENAEFAEACEAQGIRFIGPTPEQMRAFSLKHTARELAMAAGVPLLPGTGLLKDAEEAIAAAEGIGYPVILKSTAGGGGIGMHICASPDELKNHFAAVQRLSASNFGSADVFLEKYVVESRHVEVQVFGDGHGEVLVLGERDCSLQRRNQKVVEETPAPGITDAIREQLGSAATRLMKSISYRSAGTVEFLYDASAAAFYFLEVNTRLQVEHGVTEMVTGVDLVEMMVRVAAGESPRASADAITFNGHAIEARIYAEDPNRDFQPSAGLLTRVEFPDDARVDTWIESGTEVSPFYDPLLAKIMVHASSRIEALAKLRDALGKTRIDGIETNVPYLLQVIDEPKFVEGNVSTRLLNGVDFKSATIDILSGGTMTTIQDYPGRIGYWEVGVPPSGPMDALAFRLANKLVGNPDTSAGLEMTMTGATMKFHSAAAIAITGASMSPLLEGKPIDTWKAVKVEAGQTLQFGSATGGGCRTYLAIRGGLDVPHYLDSRATFGLGRFGGHGGRSLVAGDVLRLHAEVPAGDFKILDQSVIPQYPQTWDIGVLYGPHAAPEFFTTEYLETFLNTAWEVHFNSARTGVRLIGPKPGWTRPDGGEAGLHPSNIHDNPYAVGTIDFTGDMPVILGPDGPSLGGFVCPATVVSSELWKLGQLRPGDRIRFYVMDEEEASQRLCGQETWIEKSDFSQPLLAPVLHTFKVRKNSPVLSVAGNSDDETGLVCRASGDSAVLIECGPPKLDIALRFKVHQLYTQLVSRKIPGVINITPGVRSLQLHYDNRRIPRKDILELIHQVDASLGNLDEATVPSRIVYLPLSWDDPSTREAIGKYHATVRPDAPWYPCNIDFIRRINGLDSIEDVYNTVFNASYVVLGLGDVYLGAPVATPLDPRHRLVTTKYNPARTWTPENAVGIGGAYLCIYGMEGPGGYQFVGRTLQMWNRHRVTEYFGEDTPWLLRFFDQIRFFPVSADELATIREDFPKGRYPLQIEETEFSLKNYRTFLDGASDEIEAFRKMQRSAFDAERQRWEEAGQQVIESFEEAAPEIPEAPEGALPVESNVAGSIWKVEVSEGDTVSEGDVVAVVESMKMEMSIASPLSGVVVKVVGAPGNPVKPGQPIAYIRPGE